MNRSDIGLSVSISCVQFCDARLNASIFAFYRPLCGWHSDCCVISYPPGIQQF